MVAAALSSALPVGATVPEPAQLLEPPLNPNEPFSGAPPGWGLLWNASPAGVKASSDVQLTARGASAFVLQSDGDSLVRTRRLDVAESGTKNGPPYWRTGIRLELVGPYVAVKRALADLLARHPGLALRTLELQRLQAERGAGTEVALRAELRLFEPVPAQPNRPGADGLAP